MLELLNQNWFSQHIRWIFHCCDFLHCDITVSQPSLENDICHQCVWFSHNIFDFQSDVLCSGYFKTIVTSHCNSKSLTKPLNQIASFFDSVATIYLAFVVDKATANWNVTLKLMTQPESENI